MLFISVHSIFTDITGTVHSYPQKQLAGNADYCVQDPDIMFVRFVVLIAWPTVYDHRWPNSTNTASKLKKDHLTHFCQVSFQKDSRNIKKFDKLLGHYWASNAQLCHFRTSPGNKQFTLSVFYFINLTELVVIQCTGNLHSCILLLQTNVVATWTIASGSFVSIVLAVLCKFCDVSSVIYKLPAKN